MKSTINTNTPAAITNRKFFHRGYLLLSLLLHLILTACGNQEPSYQLTDGSKLKLSDLQGRVVFINYWAEWCQPCREEIPELNALQQQHGNRAQVLAVNFDGISGDELIKQSEALGIKFPILTTDPRHQFSVQPSGALPETLVISPQGDFQKVLLGPQTVEALESIIDELMP